MHKLGFAKADIVRWIGHDVRTIDHWISHYEEHGNVEDEQRSGRPLLESGAFGRSDNGIVK